MCALLLALGLLTLGSNLGCEAFFLRKVQRGPCLARNPLGLGFVQGTCVPKIQCIGPILHGITHFKLPEICGYEQLMPMLDRLAPSESTPLACIPMACSSENSYIKGTTLERYQALTFLRCRIYHAVAASDFQSVPKAICQVYTCMRRVASSDRLTRPRPHVPHRLLPPHRRGGWRYLIRLCTYPPGPAVPRGPVIPRRPTNPSGPVVPSKPLVPSGPVLPPTPDLKPAPAVPHEPVVPSRPTNPPGPVVPSKPLVPSGPLVPSTPVNKPGPAVPREPVIPSRPTNPPGPVVPSKPLVPSGPLVPPTPVNKPVEGPNDGAPCDKCEPGENDFNIDTHIY
ncbi:hypothetical protein MTO96_017211 [Rhipicephalus appendiculatus]